MNKFEKFTHLHVHTEYSLLDGASKIKELIAKTKELGMDSIAITDHGVMYGVIDFYKESKRNGIKPIIGCEVYIANKTRFCKQQTKDNFYYHLVLLAENNIGYQNLIKLVSLGFTEGFYYKPRVDIELLEKYKEGLIALSACLSGPISKTLLRSTYENAKEMAIKYNKIFGQNNFFIELQDHGLKEQKEVNEKLIKISEETKIPLVATNDTHYINKEDVKAHEVLLCIQVCKNIYDEDRIQYKGGQFYLKSQEEMYEIFKNQQDALENSYKIAKRCNVDIEFNKYKLPKYKLPEGRLSFEYLEEICHKGLNDKYKENMTESIKQRLRYELNIINNMGFTDYFLITWDFIKYAKDNDIIVGPGRGSAAGSLVSYALNITTVDPIKYNLIFERFLNPERISMPDIDIDFCYERRQEVIDYVIKKYGEDHVAQIITFGTMAARNSIRDVGRALAIPYKDVDKIAKMIPIKLGITIEDALEINQDLKISYETEEITRDLIDMSKKLEGTVRHASTHAAGIVICDKPVYEYVPLNQNDGIIATQFSMTTLEELGLLKMDFLGLRTLTVIKNSIIEIKRTTNKKIDIDNINFEDSKVYELISMGKTEGLFQLESSGMKNFLKELKPNCLEDIIAGISLYRPGPMDFIPMYVKVKNSKEEIKYIHPLLENILKPTYGCIVYQEQVMEIVRQLAGYSLGRSDILRRAMGKKKLSVMQEERNNFIYGIEGEIPGCIKNGISKEIAEKIFDDMVDFAKYAFNKSHATAYAIIGYQTAWLKTYYPLEFMAALMSSVIDSTEKVSEYIDECKKMSINLLPPNINKSYERFSVEENSIRFGLLAIKNVGKSTIKSIIKERDENGQFISMTEFVNRLDGKDINKRCLESLIKAGCFDTFGGKRSQYLEIFKNILSEVNNTKKNSIEGQITLFELIEEDDGNIFKDELPNIEEYSIRDILFMEKEVLGVYTSGHPLSEYEHILKKFANGTSKNFIVTEQDEEDENKKDIKDGDTFTLGGMLVEKSIKITKTNKQMAFIKLEDLYGIVEVIIFPNIYEKYSDKLKEGEIIIVKGNISLKEDDDSKLIANKITFLTELENDDIKKVVWIKINKDINIKEKNIIDILEKYKGNTPVIIYDEKSNKKIKLKEFYNISLEDNLFIEINNILGKNSILTKDL